MLSLSQTSGYAILALACLDQVSEQYILAKDIAACTGIRLPYLSKILYALSQAGLVDSKRGYRGGFRLVRPADELSIAEIVDAIDGPDWCNACLLGFASCSDERACPTHSFWSEERRRIRALMERITVREVAEFERQNPEKLGQCRCRPDDDGYRQNRR